MLAGQRAGTGFPNRTPSYSAAIGKLAAGGSPALRMLCRNVSALSLKMEDWSSSSSDEVRTSRAAAPAAAEVSRTSPTYAAISSAFRAARSHRACASCGTCWLRAHSAGTTWYAGGQDSHPEPDPSSACGRRLAAPPALMTRGRPRTVPRLPRARLVRHPTTSQASTGRAPANHAPPRA